MQRDIFMATDDVDMYYVVNLVQNASRNVRRKQQQKTNFAQSMDEFFNWISHTNNSCERTPLREWLARALNVYNKCPNFTNDFVAIYSFKFSGACIWTWRRSEQQVERTKYDFVAFETRYDLFFPLVPFWLKL